MLDTAQLPQTPTTESTSTTLRLIWPQWQGATAGMVAELVPEITLETARRGYAVGSEILAAVLPAHSGPTVIVPVAAGEEETPTVDGIESKDAVLLGLADALRVIAAHEPERILTLGGECSVSVAPFAALAEKYGDDLAVVWIDSHPDVGTPDSDYHGYHAMAVSVLTGHGDDDVLSALPATVPAAHVALAGLHSWTDDDFPNTAEWGISTFSPSDLRTSTAPLLEWLAATGCSRVAIHLDVDVVDSDEIVLGLGAEPGGLRTEEVRRVVADLHDVADVVGLTIAEFVPRQVIRLQTMLRGFPLLSGGRGRPAK